MRRNTDVNLRRLERAYLADVNDRALLSRLVVELARSGGEATQALSDLWDSNDLEPDNEDFDAVLLALVGVYGDFSGAMTAANAFVLERELVDVDDDDMDQDQRNPTWRCERFHSIGFDFSRPHNGGSFYSPCNATVVSVSEVQVGGRDAFLVTETEVSMASLTVAEDVAGEIAGWAASGRPKPLSAWALDRTLAAATVAMDLEPQSTPRMTLVCVTGDLVSRTERRGRKTVRIDPLQDAVDSLLPGARRDTGQGSRDRWIEPTTGSALDVWPAEDRGGLRDALRNLLATRHGVAPYPYHVRLEDLRADFDNERGNDSLTLTHVPTDETVWHLSGDEEFPPDEDGEDGDWAAPRTLVGVMVEDGFLDSADWTTSAAQYAHDHGLIVVEDFV